MRVFIYLATGDASAPVKGEQLTIVDLEVVPGGTYVIDGVPYTLVGRPTFNIKTNNAKGYGVLMTTEILVVKAT